MIEDNKLILVKNRFDGHTGYAIPDLNLQRGFAPREQKQVTFDELRRLSYQPGGKIILSDYLVIDDDEAVKELLGEVEPEYYYSEEDVKNVMLNGTIEEFLDMLDFSPTGIIDIIKSLAVNLELNDVKKREAIFDKTGFNVDKAIANLRAEKEAEKNEGKETNDAQPARRVSTSIKKENSTGRRAATPGSKYKVVSKNDN